MRKNGLGKTEKSILSFVKKQIGKKIFSPSDLFKAGYQGDRRVLLNTLPRLARKGFLERLFKGAYRLARSGRPRKEDKPVLRASKKKLSSEEWKMKISARLEKVTQEIASCDQKAEMRVQKIKDTQAEIEELSRQKKEFEKELEKWRKVDDLFRTDPSGFKLITELAD